MTLEATLFILLGFLLAIFLVLLLAPVVWNRASTLTEARVRSNLPIRPEEIEAEKDKLRAEHAMVVRRFEMGIKELKEKLNNQTTKFHTKLRDNAVLTAKSLEDDGKIAALEEANAEMRRNLEERESEIKDLTGKLSEIAKGYEELRSKHETMTHDRSSLQQELSNAKIELMAKDAKIVSLDTTNLAEHPPESAESGEIYSLNEQISLMSNELIEKGSRIVELEAELARQAIHDEFTTLSENGAFTALDNLKAESKDLSTEIKSLAQNKRNTAKASEEKKVLRKKIKNLSSKAKTLSGRRG